MEPRENLDLKGWLVVAAGIIAGICLIVAFFMILKDRNIDIIPNLSSNYEEIVKAEGDMIEDKIVQAMEVILDESLIKNTVEVDELIFERNNAGQKVLEDKIMIDNIRSSDIDYPVEMWKDPKFFSVQLQKSARQIYLMERYENYIPQEPYVKAISAVLDGMSYKEKMEIYVNNPEHFEYKYSNQTLLDEVSTATMTFLTVYMDLWDLAEIHLGELEDLKDFEKFGVSYGFKIYISGNFGYDVGVKIREEDFKFKLEQLYLKPFN